jgi:hypothetical protein
MQGTCQVEIDDARQEWVRNGDAASMKPLPKIRKSRKRCPQAAIPGRDLIGVNAEMSANWAICPVALAGGQSHLCLEGPNRAA